MNTTISQAKDIAKGVNVTKLLDIAHERGEVKTTTPAARACWLYLLKKSYVASGLMLYSHDYAWAGGFEFEAKDGWTTITYKELDPANPLDEDFDPQKEDTDDCSDIDFQVIDEALASGVLDPNGPEHAEIVKLLRLEVKHHYDSENDGLVDSLLALDMSSHTKKEPIVNGRYVTKGEVQP